MVDCEGFTARDVTKNYLRASEEELLEMVEDTWNPTQFSDFELWGIRDALRKGWVKPSYHHRVDVYTVTTPTPLW